MVEAGPANPLGWGMLAKACKLVGKLDEIPAIYRRCAELVDSAEQRAFYLARAASAESERGSSE